ncbi:MAG: DUF4292 domain-containing protein [Saprospiraceae bacterium]|nr:DUF4292 domain-containing protein [Saprospiraceae bacterium]
MNKNFYFILLSCFSLVLTLSCSSSKKISKTPTQSIKDPNELIQALEDAGNKSTFLSAKMDISYNNGAKSFAGNGNIRVIRDSVIWLNIKKLGIEIARIKIDKDSLHILDRINSAYIRYSLPEIGRRYNIPFGFDELQRLFFSQIPIIPKPPVQIVQEGDSYEYEGTKDDYDITTNLVQPHFVIKNYTILDEIGRQLEINYDNYIIDEKIASFLSLYTQSGGEDGYYKVEFNFSDINLRDAIQIKFDIPSHYSKR